MRKATNKNPACRIDIIGCGLNGYRQLTVEAIEAANSANVLFYSGSKGALPDALEARDQQRIDIDAGAYQLGQHRRRMYRRMAEQVVSSALEVERVAVLQPGSAIVVDLVTQYIRQFARNAGVSVGLLPGISCIETTLCQVGYDPARGLQIALAQNLVLMRQRLSPAFAAIVIQPGYYDSLWWAGASESRPGRFDKLQARLAETCAPESIMCLVLAASYGTFPKNELWFVFRDWDKVTPLFSPLHTLFIPSASHRTVDEEFAERIQSWQAVLSHLNLDESGDPIVRDVAYWTDYSENRVTESLKAHSDEIAKRWSHLLDDGSG